MKTLATITTLLIITLFFSISLNAQEDEWKTISPMGEEFSLQMPNSYYKEMQTNFVEDKYVRASYHSFANNTYYLLTTEKYSNWSFVDSISNIANDNSAEIEKVTFGKIEGNIYRFKDKDAFNNVAITISTEKRNYVFHILGYNLDEEGIDKFIKSIKFNETSKNGVPPEQPKFEKLTKISENQLSNSLLGSKKPTKPSNKVDSRSSGGIGSGFGTGSGSGSGQGNAPPPKPTKVIKRTTIKILSKAKPGYTDWARSYNVSGMVRVRVAFLANGKIGGVSVVQGLPLGLTENAIKAALLIEFEPPTKNGVPYSSNKVVQYSFRIY